MAYFSKFNTEMIFDLPEAIQGTYLKIREAQEKYGDEVIPVIGFGVSLNKSPRAVSPENAWLATEEEFINIPGFQIPKVKEMLEDRNAINLTKQGHLGARIVSYENMYGTQLKIEWVDR